MQKEEKLQEAQSLSDYLRKLSWNNSFYLPRAGPVPGSGHSMLKHVVEQPTLIGQGLIFLFQHFIMEISSLYISREIV